MALFGYYWHFFPRHFWAILIHSPVTWEQWKPFLRKKRCQILVKTIVTLNRTFDLFSNRKVSHKNEVSLCRNSLTVGHWVNIWGFLMLLFYGCLQVMDSKRSLYDTHKNCNGLWRLFCNWKYLPGAWLWICGRKLEFWSD